MNQVKNGDIVKVHYTGTLNDGSVFDTSRQRQPLEFAVGQGQLLKGFENAVVGMKVGDSVEIEIPAAEGYGLRRDELVGKIARNELPPDITPEIGMKLQMQTPENQQIVLTVVAVTDDEVTLDANHDLAGQDLKFQIELMEINATE